MTSVDLLSVDKTLCIHCGSCAVVCPRGLIRLEQGWPVSAQEDLCIACGHCVAVCPVAALDNRRTPLFAQSGLSTVAIDDETIRSVLRSRRSIRSFKNKPVERQKLLQLMDIARFAPSGGNSQGISYIVIEDRQVLQQLTEHAIQWMENQSAAATAAAPVYRQYVAMYRQQGKDSVLRNAPCLIVATAAASFARGRENSLLSLAYVELYSPSLKLGSCWAGLLEGAAFAGYEPVLNLLAIPAEKQLTGLLMVGHPECRFHRLPDRLPLDISFRNK
jgi:nitroreductase/NAD-dependent dihydropyrimidine dehydrogenase PreA subunit